ncbi:MAG TPA: retropepsin-like aspartic protease [Nostocaceae cyanobacterium]|nr:retropepsin-like aspartic protease [Nostocaceae cyanobacterium]
MLFSNSSIKVKYLSVSHQPHQRKNPPFGVLVASLILASMSPFLPTPALGQSRRQTNSQTLGNQLLQIVSRCINQRIPNINLANETEVQNVALDCLTKEVMLDNNGKLRPDANERVAAFIEATGVKMPPRVGKGKANIQLNLLSDSQLFTLPVRVGNSNKTFLLDTGSGQTIINSQLAKQLGLDSVAVPPTLLQQKPVIGGNFDQISASVFTLPTLFVSSASVSNLYVLGLPQQSIPDNFAGVLGLDFLSSFDVIINPKARQLQLLPPSRPVSGAIPLKGNSGILTAQVYINNQGPFNMIVDTGATAMILSKSTAAKLGINPSGSQQDYILGFGGLAKAQRVKLGKVKIQQHQANNLEGYVLENSPIFNVSGIQGIIGQNFLNQYRQHWRFGQRNSLGFVQSGSLFLTPQ